MTDYSELIERLRTDAIFDNTLLGHETADIIEALQASLIEVTSQRDEWFENTQREADEVKSLQLKLRQLQEPQAYDEPAGWKLVPVEPTRAMLSNFFKAHEKWINEEGEDGYIYRAMLAAAPKAPNLLKPLTDYLIMHIFDTHVGKPNQKYPLSSSDWKNFARAIEAAHGIGGTP